MGPEHRFVCLTEELGELGRALLVTEGVKEGCGESLEVAFARVLFELLVLAEVYGAVIERCFRQGVALLAERGLLDRDGLSLPVGAPVAAAGDETDAAAGNSPQPPVFCDGG